MIPYFQYVSLNIGPITIQVWGLFVALGIALGMFILNKRAEETRIDSKKILDLGFWIVLFGVISARIFHVIFYEPAFFISEPLEIFKIWKGGMSSFGGFFGALIAFVLFKRKANINKENFYEVADLIVFSSLFGWILGRVGCLMIHDHLGIISNSFLAINWPGGPRLDMALLEILFLIPLAYIFFRNRHTGKPDGWFTAFFLIYYGLLRFVLDYFRATDIAYADARYSGLTPAQYFGIVFFVVGIILYIKRGRKYIKKKNLK